MARSFKFSDGNIERRYPHIVELIVPFTGFNTKLDEILDWHKARRLDQRRAKGRYVEPHWYYRWCFGDPKDAKAFQAAFGGKLVKPST
jgi:hypothetical protein